MRSQISKNYKQRATALFLSVLMLFTITPLPAYAEEETNVVSATEEVGGGNSSGGENAADGESPSGREIASGSEEISGAESASSSESASAGAGASGGEDASAGTGASGGEDASAGAGASSGEDASAGAGASGGEDASAGAGASGGEDASAGAGASGGEDASAGAGASSGEDASARAGASSGEDASAGAGASGGEDAPAGAGASSGEDTSAGAGASGGENASAGEGTSSGEGVTGCESETIDIPIECIDVDVPLPEEEAEIIVEIREQIRIKMLPGEDSVAPESYMERNLAVIDGMIQIPELPADVLSSPEGDELFEYHFVNWATDTGELMNAGDWCVCGFDELTLTARWQKVVRKDILPEIKEQESFDGKTVTMGVELPAINQYFLTVTTWQYSDNDRGNPDAATWVEIPEAVGNIYTRTVESGDVGREFRCILTARDVSLMSDILFETISLHTQEEGTSVSDAPAGDDVSSSEGFVAEDSALVGRTAPLPEDDPSVVAVFASQPASPVQERITTHLLPGEGNGEQIDGFLKVRAAGGRSVTVPELPLFTAPAGDALYRYVFSGWKLEDGTILKNGGEYALPADGGELTLTAQWSKQVKVELPDPTVSLAEDGTATFEIDLPELPGYDLTVRWQYANGFTAHAANPNESEDPANATDTVNPVGAAGTQNAEQTDGEHSVHTEESDAGFTAGLNAAIRPDEGEIAQWHDIPDASGAQYVRTIESGDYSRHFRCVAYAVEAEAALVEVSPEDSQVDFHVYMLTAEPGTGTEEKAIVALFPEEQSDDGDQTAGVAASQPEAQPKERGVAAKTVKSPTPESLGTGRRETVEIHAASAGTVAKPSLMRAALTKMSPQAEDSPSERFAARRVFTSSGSEAMQKETPEVLVSGAVDLRAPTVPAANTVGWNADGTVYTPTKIVNGSFEEFQRFPDSRWMCHSDNVPGWLTSASDHTIEIQDQSQDGTVPADGGYYAELNAHQVSTLYQDLPTTPGEVIMWSLYHRGRLGTDAMNVAIGPDYSKRKVVETCSDGQAWRQYSGHYRIPTGQTISCFSFVSISAAGGNQSIGNYLDGIEFKTVISPAYVKMEGATMTMRVYSEVATTATLCYQIDGNNPHEVDGAMVNKYASVSVDLQELVKAGKLNPGKHTLYVWPKNSEELRSKKSFEITAPLTGVSISASNRVYTGMDTGRTLTASLLPTEGTAAYQWKRNGVDIPGATGTSYVLSDEDGDFVVSVSVTGTGYYTGSVTASFHVDPAVYIFDLTLRNAEITPVSNITGNSTPYPWRVQHTYNGDAIAYKITPRVGYQLPTTVRGLTSGKDVTYTLAADGKTATLLLGRKATNLTALIVEVTPINYAFTLTLNHAAISPTTNLTGTGSPYTVSHVYDTTEVEYTITADDHYQLPETATGLVTGKDVTYTRSADGKTATLKVGEKAANTAALTVAATSLTYTFTITMDNAHISPDTNLTHQGSTYRVNHVYGADAVEYVISPDRGYALPETVAGLTAGAGVTYQKAPGTNHTATLKVERTSVYTGDITIEPILWKTYNVFLDQANGDDNNLGSRAQPVKTLGEAKLRLFQNGVDNAINGYDESKLATIWVKSTYSLGSNENWNLLGYGAWDADRHEFNMGCIRRDPLCEGYLFQTGTSGSVRLDNMVLDGNDMAPLAFQDTSGTSFTTADMRRISGKRYASILCVSAGATVELGSNAIVRGNTATSHSAASQQTLEGCGGGVIVYGTLNLQGSITSNTAQESGGGVMVATGGTLRINGGKIFTNEAKNGGGIAVAQGGSLLLEQGGRVFTNKAHSGGGVSVDNGGTLSINSGDISGNRAEDTAGGVYLNGNMEISGQVSVRENIVGAIGAAEKAGNVYLCADKHMTVTGSLESSDSQKSDIHVGTANNAANDLIAVGKDGPVKLDSASAGYFTPEGVLPIIYRAAANGKAAGLYLGGDFINISVPMKLMFAAFSNYNSGQVLSPEYSIVNNSPYYEMETEVYCGARTLQGGTDGFKLQDEVRGLRLEPVSGFHGGTGLTSAVFLHDAPAGGTLADEAKYSLGLIDRASKNAAGETVGAQGVFKFTGALGGGAETIVDKPQNLRKSFNLQLKFTAKWE